MNTYMKDLEKVKNHLRENPQGLTVLQISEFLNVNRNSVAKYMDVLYISGQVEMRQIGPAKLYILSSCVPTSHLLDYSNDAMIFFDNKFDIINVNKKFRDLFSYEEDELISENIKNINSEFFISEDFQRDCKKVKEIGSAKNTIKIEYNHMRKFLSYRFFKTIFDNGNNGYGLIISDITPSKERELDLKFRVKFDELIATIATEFIGIEKNQIEEELYRAIKKIGEVGEVDRVFIYLFSDDMKSAQCIHHWSKNPQNRDLFEKNLDLEKYAQWMNKLLDLELVYIFRGEDLEKNQKNFLKDFGLSTVAMSPLISNGNLVGCLGIAMENDSIWSQKIINMLTMSSKVFAEVFKKYHIEYKN